MKTILERVSFRKLSTHPARTGAMRNDSRHAAHVGNWMAGRQFAKSLQLGQQLQYNVLMNVIGLSSLDLAMRVEAEFETNNSFNYRLGMDRDEL